MKKVKKTYRINLSLPPDMERKIKRLAKKHATKPSELLREIIIGEVNRLEREAFREKMIEGARYMAEENRSLSAEFAHVDLEGWEG